MRVIVQIDGSLKERMAKEYLAGEKAVQGAMAEAAAGAKADFRTMTVSGGLGPRLARAWRSEVYPKGTVSMKAAGLVYTKAPKIIRAFTENTTIKSRDGFWLAIPTDNAPAKGVDGKRITPTTFPEHRYGRLRFIYRPGRRSALLVADGVRIGRKTGRVGKQAKGGALTKSGRYKTGITSVVMFVLVPRVRLRKRIDVNRVAQKWGVNLASRIVARWEAMAGDR